MKIIALLLSIFLLIVAYFFNKISNDFKKEVKQMKVVYDRKGANFLILFGKIVAFIYAGFAINIICSIVFIN